MAKTTKKQTKEEKALALTPEGIFRAMGKQHIPTFQDFWDAYAYKRDRMAAERAWNRLSARDKRDAFAGIAAYSNDCQRRGVSRMYGQGYLTHRRWEDDFTQEVPTPTKADVTKTPDAASLDSMELW